MKNDKEAMADIIIQTNHAVRGDLLMDVANLLLLSGQNYTASVLIEAAENYGLSDDCPLLDVQHQAAP